MVPSILLSLKTGKNVPETFQIRWRILTYLMIFFLGGYLSFLVIQLKQLDIAIELITGVVFFGGALFVFLIINLSRNTVMKIREGEQLLRSAKDQLEIRVNERTQDLKKALDDLEIEIAERKKTATSLEEVNVEILQILNTSADGIRVIDKNFTMLRVNHTFAEMAGIPEKELIGRPCHQLGLKGHACDTPDCPVQKILNGAERVDCEVSVEGADGKIIPCLVTAFPYHNPDGELIGVVEGFRDISERKQMEDKLREISITDELTGVLNRRGFLAMAEKQIYLSGRMDKSMYLLYADIDNMKWINDNLGHRVGDEALIESADILKSTFRKADVIGIGRLGGDEFAILMFSDIGTCCDHPVQARLENNITEKNKEPDRAYNLSISTGIVKYDPENPCSIEEFISLGDEAMYICKKERKKKLMAS
jgi:diguanylate cyclase (GGDEF)-like protein/PAS domain S-box-containing protein